ncbi:MAG: hypothetical protein GY719_02005, partial [bacterium]|nr:hypothetical protein [bacterium]
LAGGYLAVVADVVLASIANALNSGLSVNFAETLFDQAEELRADEEYKYCVPVPMAGMQASRSRMLGGE